MQDNRLALLKERCKSLNVLTVPCAILVVVCIGLVPYASTGLWDDDTLNSSVWGEVNRSGTSLLAFSWLMTTDWLHACGRFIPLALFQTYYVFYWLHELWIYRAAQLILLSIHVALFGWLLRCLGLSWRSVGIWVMCLLATFQIRDYHDPIASYAFLIQAQGIQLTLALLIIVVRWNESPRFRWLVLGAGLLLTSLLYSELNLIGFPMAMMLIGVSKQPIKTKVRACLFLGAVLLSFLAATFYARASLPIVYAGTRLGKVSSFAETYVRQWSAAFPGVFYVFRYRRFFSVVDIVESFCKDWHAWLLFAAAAYAVRRCMDVPPGVLKQCRSKELALVAGSLVFITPVFCAISEKYQQELSMWWGWGYLHVYYAYFGIALCAAVFLTWTAQRDSATRIVLAVILAFCITANWIVNRSVCAVRNEAFSMELRKATAFALKNGLLDSVRDGDLLVLTGMPFYMNSNFVYQFSKKKVVLEGDDGYIRMPRAKLNANPQRFKIEYRREIGTGWRIALVKLQR